MGLETARSASLALGRGLCQDMSFWFETTIHYAVGAPLIVFASVSLSLDTDA